MGSKGKMKSMPRTGKNKGKRWKKGHSSTSNPESNRFREAAKNRFFSANTGQSTLTVDALAKHDETNEEMGTDGVEGDRQTAGTFKTWATNWTECTNTTFSKVHRYWSSNSALHKEILAVLAAITEVIKTEGGTETETEYFAALMTALESSDNEQSMSAIVYLISIVIKRVPTPVLRKKFSEVAKCFLEILGRSSDGESTSLFKSLITSLAFLLRAQEQAVWNNSSTQQVYKGLLTFINHRKPKVRKAAQEGVCIVLKGSLFMTQESPPPHHPAASLTTKHCIQLIEGCGGTGESADSLYTLALLKSLLPVLPHNSVKSACETILRVMTISNVMVKSAGMKALHGLFSGNPKPTSLPADLNAQIITALYDYQPSENDVQPTQAWLVVMETAHVNLSRLDEKLCMSHLPRLFTTCMVCLLSEKSEITQATTKTLKSVIEACIIPMASDLKELLNSAPEGATTPVHKIVRALESGLSYQFHASWSLVLQLFSAIYKALGRECSSLFIKSLKSISELRDSVRFPYKAELDHAIGCAVRAMGPKVVLQAVPLQITGQSDDLDFPRSWLLPVIRDNVMETELGFFTSYFLPLAARLRQRAQELSAQENIVACKTYEALQLQIWSLLPGFCTKPTDLAVSFKGLAKVMGTAISEREDLRMQVMSSLRKLINQSLQNEESWTEMSKFAKNFLPIFFNLYTADPVREKDPVKLAVFETIKCYFQITEKPMMVTFCEKCKEKLKEDSITSYKRYALYDLLMAMLPYLSSDKIRQIYDIATDHIQELDKSLQKKCYRILEDICFGSSEELQEFVNSNLATIQGTLLMSLSSSSPSSKAPRLRCLINIFKHLESQEQDFLLACVPEAILCTKEVAERARAASYNLLVEMGNAVIRWSEDQTDGLQEYFKMVLAGLAGSPQMISATLLALTRILYEFKDKISDCLLKSVIENLCLLLRSKSREVVQSALGFTKVLLSAYPNTVLAAHLQPLLSSLVSMKEDCHHHFRFKSKEIYAKLIKKFGYEMIYHWSPDNTRKMLVNIRKTQERLKKKKKDTFEEEDEEDKEHFTTQPESIDELLEDTDSEMEDDSKEKKKKKQHAKTSKAPEKGGKAWLHEGDSEIMDFMDVSAAKKVMATKPVEKRVRKSSDSGFKTAPDGRLIITESSDEEGAAGGSDAEDIDDLLDALEQGRDSGKIKQKKRKLEDLGGSDDEGPSPSKYRAGGHGIHRPVGKKEKQSKEFGAEYKAKKAKGDTKKKGRPDPYTYVPLDHKALNKRKRAKVKGQFKNLVRGAQKGAAKGAKGRKKR